MEIKIKKLKIKGIRVKGMKIKISAKFIMGVIFVSFYNLLGCEISGMKLLSSILSGILGGG